MSCNGFILEAVFSVQGEFWGWGGGRCWVNVEPRVPGGYLSPRGSECSPVGIPPPLQGEAEGIWIGVPPGPCGARWGPFLQRPWRTERGESGAHLFVCLFSSGTNWEFGYEVDFYIYLPQRLKQVVFNLKKEETNRISSVFIPDKL